MGPLAPVRVIFSVHAGLHHAPDLGSTARSVPPRSRYNEVNNHSVKDTVMTYNDHPTFVPQQQTKTNTLAIVSLIAAFLFAIVGVITGHIALKQIEQTGEQGRGLALAGLIISYISLVAGLIMFIASFAALS